MSSTSPLPPPPSDAIDFEDLPWNLNHPEAHSYLDLRYVDRLFLHFALLVL